VAEWKEIVRLDPKSAEAWAFLSEFYDRSRRHADQIAALNKWINASPPEDIQFYQNMVGGKLSPGTALIKLGVALAKTGKIRDSVEALCRAIIEAPENAEGLETLTEILETSDEKSAPVAIEVLRQRSAENSANISLIELLAKAE